MPYADLPTGVRLFYEDLGAGTPLIAIHGWLGTARKDLGRVIDWLSEDYRVIGPSLRGYGKSRPPQRDFPHDFYHRDAGDVLALMDALDIERAHIIGYSDGGEVSLIAAGTQPERFLSVAVWGSVGYFGPDMRPMVQRAYPATWLEAEPDTLALHGIENANQFVLGWIKAVRHMIDAGGDVSLSLADQITAPVLMMLGERDTLNPAVYGRQFIDRTQNGQLKLFDAGHPVHDEQWAAFQGTLGVFLRG